MRLLDNDTFFFSLDATPCYAAKDERIVAFHGEALKIVKALEAVVGHLRKYLVDHFVIPFFEEEVSFIV